jgi:hypothetical protein
MEGSLVFGRKKNPELGTELVNGESVGYSLFTYGTDSDPRGLLTLRTSSTGLTRVVFFVADETRAANLFANPGDLLVVIGPDGFREPGSEERQVMNSLLKRFNRPLVEIVES